MSDGLLVIGSGPAGVSAAQAYRDAGGPGPIRVVSADEHPPYQRPPLSKEYLAGDKGFDRIMIRPEKFWAHKGIELVLGAAVTAIDPAANVVSLFDGTKIGYRKLIWSGGGDPRRLPVPGACRGYRR